MSQADNAAPNSIAIYGFTGSFVTLAPRNYSNGADSDEVARAFRDDAAHGFRHDVAQGASLAGC